MIKKSENCLYCGTKMESITAKKRFCSDIHRVYWNRENKAVKKLKKELENDTEFSGIIPEINNLPPIKTEIQKQIEEIKNQVIPPERNTSSWGRKSWQHDQETKINHLKSQLK